MHIFTFDRENEEQTTADFANPYYRETSNKNEVSWFGKAIWKNATWQVATDVQVRNTDLSITPDFNFLGITLSADIEDSWGFVNPKVGVSYFVTNSLTTYASFGRVGREPTRIDIIGGFGIYDEDNYQLALEQGLILSL